LIEEIDEFGGGNFTDVLGFNKESTINKGGTEIKLSIDEMPFKLNMFPSIEVEPEDSSKKPSILPF
jgi:hypothetical protein